MELMPTLKIGWLNGWLPLVLLVLTDGILFRVFPKGVVERLLDRSGWSQKQIAFTVMGKLFTLVCVVLIVFTSLKVGSFAFIIGAGLIALGLMGLVKALFDFKNTPLDQPVTCGFYRISRHPQIFMSSVVLLGTCIAVGSWIALFILIAARLFSHWGILAEEEVCFKKYGDAYSKYVKRVPRYFVFF